MKKTFIQTHWKDLVMINYEVDKDWLEQFVPAGCELELFEGKAYATVVAFQFQKTKLQGIPIPFYRNFVEINLRIYVRREMAGEVRRGVVFIKEIVAHRVPALMARLVFKENFHVMPVRGGVDAQGVDYRWGDGNRVCAEFARPLEDWGAGTLMEHIGDNFWAYKAVNDFKTLEFEVIHRPWQMRRLKQVKVEVDILTLYGEGWVRAMQPEPECVFYVDGCGVGVTLPRRVAC